MPFALGKRDLDMLEVPSTGLSADLWPKVVTSRMVMSVLYTHHGPKISATERLWVNRVPVGNLSMAQNSMMRISF